MAKRKDYKVGDENPIMPDSLKKNKKYVYVYDDGSEDVTTVTFKGSTMDGKYEFTDDRGSYFSLTHDETLDRVTENATGANVNGMGDVTLPTPTSVGSGDIPTGPKKVRKFSDILDDMEEEEDQEEEEDVIELTDEQKTVIINLLMSNNEEEINESLSKLDEGIFGSILGGIGGLAFGKSIGKLLADTLGIRENSPLYNVLTSRLVSTAIGAALGKKLNF